MEAAVDVKPSPSLDKPMVKAEKLLRQNNSSVAEVAILVGYSHLGHFATAFKKKVWYYTKSMFFR